MAERQVSSRWQDDIASVAYWYQAEPHAKFPEMLPVHLRWPR